MTVICIDGLTRFLHIVGPDILPSSVLNKVLIVAVRVWNSVGNKGWLAMIWVLYLRLQSGQRVGETWGFQVNITNLHVTD